MIRLPTDCDYESFEQQFLEAVENENMALLIENDALEQKIASLNEAYEEIETDTSSVEKELERYHRLEHRRKPEPLFIDHGTSLEFKKFSLEQELEVIEGQFRQCEDELDHIRSKIHDTFELENQIEKLQPLLAVYNEDNMNLFKRVYRIKKKKLVNIVNALTHLKKAEKDWARDFKKLPLLEALHPKLKEEKRRNREEIVNIVKDCKSLCTFYREKINVLMECVDQAKNPEPHLKNIKYDLLLVNSFMQTKVFMTEPFNVDYFVESMLMISSIVNRLKDGTDASIRRCIQIEEETNTIRNQIKDAESQKENCLDNIEDLRLKIDEKMLESVNMEFEIDVMKKEMEAMNYRLKMKQLESSFLDKSIHEVKQGMTVIERNIEERQQRIENEKKRKRHDQPLSDIGNINRIKSTPVKKKKLTLAERALGERRTTRRTRVE